MNPAMTARPSRAAAVWNNTGQAKSPASLQGLIMRGLSLRCYNHSMKKGLYIILSVVSIVVVMITTVAVVHISEQYYEFSSKDYNYIEDITGICEPVTLKPGCIVSYGSYFTRSYDGIGVAKSMASSFIDNPESEDPGILLENLRIIDVYGDDCTIVFNCEGDSDLYTDRYYPLANLEYDEEKVAAADDGVESKLAANKYTLDARYSSENKIASRNQYVICITILVILEVSALVMGIRWIVLAVRTKKIES